MKKFYKHYYYNTVFDIDEDDMLYSSYVFKFEAKDDNYYVTLTVYNDTPNHFTVGFQIEEDFLTDNKENRDFLTYSNTNKNEAFKILTSVLMVMKLFSVKNKLNSCTLMAKDDKRHIVYKYMVSRNMENWKLVSDIKIDNVWVIDYKF